MSGWSCQCIHLRFRIHSQRSQCSIEVAFLENRGCSRRHLQRRQKHTPFPRREARNREEHAPTSLAMATLDPARDVATRHTPVKTIQDSRYEYKHAIIDVYATKMVKVYHTRGPCIVHGQHQTQPVTGGPRPALPSRHVGRP